MRPALRAKLRRIVRRYVHLARAVGRPNTVDASVKGRLEAHLGADLGTPVSDLVAAAPAGPMGLWRYHSEHLRLWRSASFDALMDALLATPVPGLRHGTAGRRATYRDVFDAILGLDWPGDVYVVGGAVRDGLRREVPNDVDVAVSCPPSDLRTLCAARGWHFTSTGDYFLIGDRRGTEYLEGKDIYAQLGPLHKGEFCMNAVAYDVRNRLLVDRSGHGIGDAVHRRIRILEPNPRLWSWWIDEGKLFRFYKFALRGYRAAADEQLRFILTQTPRTYRPSMRRRCRILFRRLHCSREALGERVDADLTRLFRDRRTRARLAAWYAEFLVSLDPDDDDDEPTDDDD